uniref:Uncharacterized protein n=1 Tax=Bionectria ochroleuca TaxID=29856 RepID=A0A0B7K675_BIOOC
MSNEAGLVGKPGVRGNRVARAWLGIRKPPIADVGCRVLVVNMPLVLISNSSVLGRWSIANIPAWVVRSIDVSRE